MMGANERVFVSRQDGSSWAVAVGSIKNVKSGPVVCLSLNHPVPHESGAVYRIDCSSGYSTGAAMAGNLADFCMSDTERLVTSQIPGVGCGGRRGWFTVLGAEVIQD